jgi:hypothetical protein
MSTRMTSKTIAITEMNVRILVRLAPRSASTRENGDSRTIDPAKDRHATTQDQSPASALQLFPKNFKAQTHRSNETASKFAAPRIRRDFGSECASAFKKRSHAIPSRKGGANTEQAQRMVNNNPPMPQSMPESARPPRVSLTGNCPPLSPRHFGAVCLL